jgi:hypothetical protein
MNTRTPLPAALTVAAALAYIEGIKQEQPGKAYLIEGERAVRSARWRAEDAKRELAIAKIEYSGLEAEPARLARAKALRLEGEERRVLLTLADIGDDFRLEIARVGPARESSAITRQRLEAAREEHAALTGERDAILARDTRQLAEELRRRNQWISELRNLPTDCLNIASQQRHQRQSGEDHEDFVERIARTRLEHFRDTEGWYDGETTAEGADGVIEKLTKEMEEWSARDENPATPEELDQAEWQIPIRLKALAIDIAAAEASIAEIEKEEALESAKLEAAEATARARSESVVETFLANAELRQLVEASGAKLVLREELAGDFH